MVSNFVERASDKSRIRAAYKRWRAIGRPLFGRRRAGLPEIVAHLRREGHGEKAIATMAETLVQSAKGGGR